MKELNHKDKPGLGLTKYLPQMIIVTMILLVYIQNLWFDFSYIDDNLIIFDEYNKIDSLSDIPSSFVHGYLYDNYYRPMVMISFILDTAIAGQSSMMYHLTNLIIHCIVTFLLFQILIKLEFNRNVSLIAALLFAVHPLNINAVSWIVGRNDLLLALFSMLSLLLYVKYKETNKAYLLVLSLFAYLFSILSKEAGALVPIIIFLYELLIRCSKKFKLKNYYSLLSFALPAVIYLLLRKYAAHIIVRDETNFSSFVQNIYILFEYLAKTVYYFYIDPLPMKNNTLTAIGVMVVLLLTAFFFMIRKNKEYKKFLFGFLIFLVFVLPALFVRPISDDGEFNYIDCRMYLPLFGLMILSAVIIENISPYIKRSIKIIILIAAFSYLSVFSFLNNQVYKTGLNYWNAALDKHPERAAFWAGLGFYYYDNNQFLEAARCAENAIKIKPDITEFYQKASLAYEGAGELLKANDVLERLLKIDKDNPVTFVNIIKNYLRLKQIDKADEWSETFLELNIKDEKTRADLSSSISYYYTQSRQFNPAIKFMKTALDIFPDNPAFNNDLGALYVNTGMLDSAKIYFNKAINIDPGNMSFRRNLNYVQDKLK